MILDEIVAKRKEFYKEKEKEISLDNLLVQIGSIKKEHKLYELCKEKNFILFTECKKASPSKGIISNDYPYLEIAKAYEKAGTDVISCLTEPNYFLGSDEHFKEIRKNVNCLMLRKDFIFSSYQIFESKVMGADVILLICAILTEEELKAYLCLTENLGMCALVEAHDEDEINKAIRCGAKVIGVNNRNLKDFSVDFTNALNLRKKYPNIYMISESGVKTPKDINILKKAGLNGALVGEALMKAPNPYLELLEYRKASSIPKIKFCGMRRKEDIDAVNILKPDFVGFVFAEKSKRKLTIAQAARLKKNLSEDIVAIGVFLNQPINMIVEACEKGIIDIVQLHGNEDDNYIKELKSRVDNEVISVYRKSKYAESVMYDSKNPGQGIKATYYNRAKKTPVFLAGGIDINNIDEIKLLNPYAIDMSTSIETDGFKDFNKMEEIIKKVRNYE